ncbi:MAG: DNA-processing protein DprA [Paludibacteraceae bacterium]|nr:DNA-processing protein DprA [Paludibacteraceae bacterium]
MHHDELLYQLALVALYPYRLRLARQLLSRYGTAREAWEQLDEPGKAAAWQRAEQEAEFIQRHGIQTWFCTDEDYPRRLRQCADYPIMLFGKGNIRHSEGKMVSVVGTRRATERGKELTRRLVLELAQLCPDVTIISGLAYGIDVAAHRAALEADLPTIIVPAHGLDRIYPSVHRQVAVEALQQGGILTEYMSGNEPEKSHFVARNRIVAGLADAVVVAESRAHGGSLITANMAIDYNRDLFAFPGRPGDEEYRGCNDLIRLQKATLIDSAMDLVQAMNWQPAEPQPANEPTLFESTDTPILALVRSAEDGIPINSIVEETGMDYSEVSAELVMLELEGKVRALPGGIYRILN